ncbi:MAG: DMT family transporter [Bacteroidales bacterium]|nr:DMT family transporter [Bacteroidales bacterium]
MFSLKDAKIQLIVLFILAFIWGSSFILIKKSLIIFSDTEVAALRIFISALVLIPFGLNRIKTLSSRDFWNVVLSGIIGTGIPAFLFAIAQRHITSSEASIYNSLTPLFTLLFAFFMFNTKVHVINFMGIILGLAGAIFLITQRTPSQAGFSSSPEYGILLVVATIMYGYNTNHVKHKLAQIDGITIVSVSFLIMLVPSSLFIFTPTFFQKVSNEYFMTALLYMSILAILGTSLALIIWNKLIKNISAIYASTVTYIIPVFALMWGLYDSEKLHWNHGIAIICIFTGIYLVNYKSKNGI